MTDWNFSTYFVRAPTGCPLSRHNQTEEQTMNFEIEIDRRGRKHKRKGRK